jgi:hypothetical protein
MIINYFHMCKVCGEKKKLETKGKACRQVRYLKLSLSNSVWVSADGSWGRGDVEGWERNCVCEKGASFLCVLYSTFIQ